MAPQRPSAVMAAELCRSVDVVVIGSTLIAATFLANLPRIASARSLPLATMLSQHVTLSQVLVLAVYAIVWRQMFIVAGLSLYGTGRRISVRREIVAAIATSGVGALFVLSFPRVGLATSMAPSAALIVWGVVACVTIAARSVIRRFVAEARSAPRHVVIVGSGPRALRLHDDLCVGRSAQCELVGFVDDCFDHGADLPDVVRRSALGTVDDLERLLMRAVVDEVLIALPVCSQYAQIQHVIDVCDRVGIECRYPVDIFQARRARSIVTDGRSASTVRVPVAADDGRLVVKRVVDIIGAAVAIVLLSPVFALIWLAIRVTSPGPALFVQRRYGHRKRLFPMFKFRTMVTDAETLLPMLESQNEAVGPVFKIREDPRITRIGGFLRRSSLDELPQLFNVLRGEMSLVGPRPMSMRDVGRFTEPWLMRRFSVLPGVTCLWQINGRSNLSFDDWIALDLEYIDHWSLMLDSYILARTIPAVLGRSGAV